MKLREENYLERSLIWVSSSECGYGVWVWGLIWVSSSYSRWGKFTTAMDHLCEDHSSSFLWSPFPMNLSLHPIAAGVEWRISFLSAAGKSLPRSPLLCEGVTSSSQQARKGLRREDTFGMFTYHELHKKGIRLSLYIPTPWHITYTPKSLVKLPPGSMFSGCLTVEPVL